MSAWRPEELDRIAAAQELEIAPQRLAELNAMDSRTSGLETDAQGPW